MRLILSFAVVALLAACGHDHDSNSSSSIQLPSPPQALAYADKDYSPDQSAQTR